MVKLKINEIFWSIQGEGARTGTPSIFIRFSGCSLGCSYCDSKNAWDKGEYLSVDEVISKVEQFRDKYPSSQVVLTGGEPFEQEIDELVNNLKKKELYLTIETNGIHFQDINIDWWTVSPKDINDFRISNDIWKKISEIKLIVNKNLNFEVVKYFSEKNEEIPVFLQPQYPDKNRFPKAFSLFEKCSIGGLKNVRLGLQMHRHFNVN